ncbi:AAA family ATPase [Actinopolymorpha sp. B11F2]|uniref:HelD family protein n=1 Tax=Actinopolymorpha sp. B11F2 TaxID=3160862 RepID=UPI0032E4005A
MPTHEATQPPDTAAAPAGLPSDPTPIHESADPALAAERRHLAESRSALRQMRERTESLEAQGGNAVSTEYLKATLYHRAKALADDPNTPLFFGRLDYGVDARPVDEEPTAGLAERFYIGRRHVSDEDGDPMVVDWRASVSRPFYRATRRDPLGVELRRRFGFAHGSLTAYEDEHLTDPPATDVADGVGTALGSRILEAEIERPRVGPMRDIVATIQPEQDDIVRADLSGTVCVQGAPGTGKTAVGLHRAAFLLYAHRDQLRRQGVLVVGPNDSFLRYIGDVLPALGEIDARQSTLAELVGRTKIRGTDPPHIATLKGDARMAEILRRAVWSHVKEPSEGLVVPRGARRFRVPAYEVSEILAGIRARGVRYGAGRAILPQRLAHAILLRMEADGDSPDDRVQASVARSRPVKAYADELWPAVDPAKLVFRLLSEPEFLAEHADGQLDVAEQVLLRWPTPPRSAGSARWSLADAVLVDEAADLIERTPSLGHVVLDEAQDLSPMQLRAVGRRCSTGSATVLGDLAQATTPWATRDWTDALTHLGKSGAHVEELTKGFRVPASVIEFAARLLPHIAPTLAPPSSVRRTSGDLVINQAAKVLPAALDGVRTALDRPGSVGLVVPDARIRAVRSALDAAGISYAVLGDTDDVDAHLDVVPASLVKGLEFDHVVVLEPAAIVAAEHDEVTGLRRLYVCLTRAVTSLQIVHAEPLPAPLSG